MTMANEPLENLIKKMTRRLPRLKRVITDIMGQSGASNDQ